MFKKSILTFTFLTIIIALCGLNTGSKRAISVNPSNDSTLFSKMIADTYVQNTYVISAYDDLIKLVSEKEGNDWRLMSAIAYHESRFMPNVVSHCGAKGLMQVMPIVARQFNTPQEKIANPEINVWLANRLMTTIGKMLNLPSDISYENRMSLILACYNGGIGHVNDARRLARVFGEDPNSWSAVSKYLKLKKLPEYYENEVVRSGRFSGSGQTLAYVDNVIKRYNEYCLVASRS